MSRNTFASLLILGLTWMSPGHAAAAEPADTLIVSNKVLTMTGSGIETAAPAAVAVRDGRIIWVGPPQQADAWQGASTELVDYGDRALLPGFIDAHGHISFSAVATTTANVASPPVGPVQTIADLQATLRAYIETEGIQPGEWVVGMGYDDSLLQEKRHPNRADLDAVVYQRCRW